VHYTRITELWNGSDDDRRLLSIYNLVDAMLPWQIMCELRTLGTLIEMARVSKTDITQQMQRGQNVKSTMLLQWEVRMRGKSSCPLTPRLGQEGGLHRALPAATHQGEDGQLRARARLAVVRSSWVVRTRTHSQRMSPRRYRHDLDAAAKAGETVVVEEVGGDDDDGPTLEAGKGKTKYTGGYVGEMKPYYYGSDEPVHTVDFESLYPSLMMSHNLCPTTQVMDKRQLAAAGLTLEKDCVQSPIDGVYFVKHEVRRGLLPAILDQILSARRVAKKALVSGRAGPSVV